MSKIKIRDQDRRPWFSTMVVVSFGVLTWYVWMLWTTHPLPSAQRRGLADVLVSYQCDLGHGFVDKISRTSQPCRRVGCLLRAWPVWSYQCSRDGPEILQLRYAQNAQGIPTVAAVRKIGGDWRDVRGTDILCPRCDRPLAADRSLRRSRVP